jgi:hypothetical protein
MSGRIVGAIIGVVVVGFLGLLMWAAQRGKPTVDSDGTLIFRHSLLFRGFTLFVAILVLVILPPFGNRPFSSQTANCSPPSICGQSRSGEADLISQGQTKRWLRGKRPVWWHDQSTRS